MQRKKKTGTDAVVTANHQRERSSTEPKADAGKTRLGSKGTMKGAKRITASKTTANKPRQGACPRSVQQGSTNLSPSLEIEQLAAEVTAEFSTVCAKLSEPKPKIEKIQSYFRESGRWSVTVAGCRSFREFCERRLHRTEQAEYSMLSPDTRKRKKKKNIPKEPTARQKSVVANKDIKWLRSACCAAARCFCAEAKGKTAEAREAKAEFFAIINTKSIKPWIVGDVPNAGDYAYRPIASPLRAAETDATPAQG
jgi:hypothetical protein